MEVGTLIRCTRCRTDWDVIEIPVGTCSWRVDPSRYICPDCRTPVPEAAQLALGQETVGRVDELVYDTSMVEMEF